MGEAKKEEEKPQAAVVDKAADGKVFELKIESRDMGRADSLRYNILSSVLAERYEKASELLKQTLENPSEYPNFHDRAHRFIKHGMDLVLAIKAKRNFVGINSLTRTKQQELREKFIEHFHELQYILKKIEKIESELRAEDIKSTIHVVRAIWVGAIAVVFCAFLVEAYRGLMVSGIAVVDDLLSKFSNWLFQLLGM